MYSVWSFLDVQYRSGRYLIDVPCKPVHGTIAATQPLEKHPTLQNKCIAWLEATANLGPQRTSLNSTKLPLKKTFSGFLKVIFPKPPPLDKGRGTNEKTQRQRRWIG